MMTVGRKSFMLVFLLGCFLWSARGFQTCHRSAHEARLTLRANSNLRLQMSDGGQQQEGSPTEYSRTLRLREEAESPFRKVRFALYLSLGGGALVSLVLSLARIAAALAGVNEELLPESATNAAVDLTGIIVLGFLYKRDLDAQESRLKRASKGAELAKLMVQCSKSIVGEDDDDSTFRTSLASLRRGRGIEKRVVIAAAGKEKIDSVMAECAELSDALEFNDLVVVPVVMPQAIAPSLEENAAIPECVGLPIGLNWKAVIEDEAQEAGKQDVDIERDGFCVILKKNGRVGQRTRGIFLRRMVGEVTERRALGLDVKNI